MKKKPKTEADRATFNSYITMLVPVAAAVIVLAAALSAYVMVKFYGVIFLGQRREKALEHAHDAGWWERATWAMTESARRPRAIAASVRTPASMPSPIRASNRSSSTTSKADDENARATRSRTEFEPTSMTAKVRARSTSRNLRLRRAFYRHSDNGSPGPMQHRFEMCTMRRLALVVYTVQEPFQGGLLRCNGRCLGLCFSPSRSRRCP